MSCNLEVDINGHETFFVSEKFVTSFSGRFRKLFEKSTGKTKGKKVIFHEFPGGAEGFELIVRFCYDGGKICTTPSNVLLLHCAANFLEINDLISQTIVLLESAHQWSLFDLIDCLKLFQELAPFEYSFCLLQKFCDCCFKSPRSSFSSYESSSFQLSGEISTYSSRLSSSLSTTWLRDLGFLSVDLFEKCKLIDILINLLGFLDKSFISFRSLCNILRVSKVTKSSIKKLECLIGSRLDEATLDDLLVSPRPRKHHAYAYDVDLILRFLKAFLEDSRKNPIVRRLKKVVHLIDLYIAEIAPDPSLKPSKFRALVFALPDFARDSHDRIYEAIDMYFSVHKFVGEEEKIKICSAMNYNKFSSDSWISLSHNANFPARVKKCRRRETKVARAKKFDVNCSNNGRSLPRLCS